SRKPKPSGGSIAPMRSIHTAVLKRATRSPPGSALALADQTGSTYQLAPTKGLSSWVACEKPHVECNASVPRIVAIDRLRKIAEIFIVPSLLKIDSMGAADSQKSIVRYMRTRIIS